MEQDWLFSKLLIQGWVKSFMIFWYCEAQFSCSECFYQSHECNEPQWTVRCWAQLIPFKFCFLYLPLRLGEWTHNPYVLAYLTMSDSWGLCKQSEISWIILLLFTDQLLHHLFRRAASAVITTTDFQCPHCSRLCASGPGLWSHLHIQGWVVEHKRHHRIWWTATMFLFVSTELWSSSNS